MQYISDAMHSSSVTDICAAFQSWSSSILQYASFVSLIFPDMLKLLELALDDAVAFCYLSFVSKLLIIMMLLEKIPLQKG